MEGVAAARHPHQEAVGREQRFGIEFDAGVFHALAAEGERLELAVVGRHDGPDPFAVQVVQDGHGQGRPFVRVRPGTDLIHQDQLAGPHFAQDGNEVFHMAGKRTQALLNTLFIPDVRVDGPENRQLRCRHRQKKSRLRHEGENPRRFQGHGLAARVGTRNEERVEIPAEADIQRHASLPGQQGMASFVDAQGAVFRQDRFHGLGLQGIKGLGIHGVHVRRHVEAAQQRFAFTPDQDRQMAQDPLHFFLFLDQVPLDFVVEVDHGQGFDKQRRPRA